LVVVVEVEVVVVEVVVDVVLVVDVIPASFCWVLCNKNF
jgi:hypothetical protein